MIYFEGMKLTLAIILILITVSVCDVEKAETDSAPGVDSLAVHLANSATERFGEYIFGRIDSPDSLEVSLNELDRAIEIEPELTELYTHKANILLALNQDKQAIHVLKKVLEIEPNFVEAITLIGFINEKNGEKEIAKEWLQRAIEGYNERIEEDEFVMNSKVNKVFIHIFLEDEEIAKNSLEKLNQEYPNDSQIEYLEQLLHNFDKELFLNELYK